MVGMAAIVAWIVVSTPLVHLLYSKLPVVAGEVTIPPLLQTRERSTMLSVRDLCRLRILPIHIDPGRTPQSSQYGRRSRLLLIARVRAHAREKLKGNFAGADGRETANVRR
jgi:hypothetical protein